MGQHDRQFNRSVDTEQNRLPKFVRSMKDRIGRLGLAYPSHLDLNVIDIDIQIMDIKIRISAVGKQVMVFFAAICVFLLAINYFG